MADGEIPFASAKCHAPLPSTRKSSVVFFSQWNADCRKHALCSEEVEALRIYEDAVIIPKDCLNHPFVYAESVAECHFAGVRTILRNSTGPWSPCSIRGPGEPSSLSSAPPVIP